MNYNDTGIAFDRLVDHLDSYDAKKRLRRLAVILDEYFKGVPTRLRKEFYDKTTRLVKSIERNEKDTSIVILKNKDNLFDMFIFYRELLLDRSKVSSSEDFLNEVRTKDLNGFVIENILSEDVLIFLKAYYIYREDAPISEDANNLVRDYSYKSLEMVGIKEMFCSEDSSEVNLKNVILYDDEVLPYSLEYLDKYRKTKEEEVFSSIIEKVADDRFVGMSLTRF